LADNSRTGSQMIEILESVNGSSSVAEPAFLIPHRKDYYLFVLVRKGESRHWVDSASYILKPDTFYFTIPSQVHLKEEMLPMQGISLRFTEEFLQLEESRGIKDLPLLQNPAGGHELRLSAADLAFVDGVLHRMLDEYAAQEPWKNQMLAAHLRVLVLYLSRLYIAQYGNGQPADNGRRLLKEFQSLVDQHHRELHEVSSYAGLMNISPGHLNDRIKEQSGKTAIHHIHARLLAEAKRQLLHTDASIKEIANALGFEDAAYFNRWFKKMTRNTPVQYRAHIRKMYH
jgi:AraC-like DNA-binding protein